MAVKRLALGLLLLAQGAAPLSAFDTTGEKLRCVHSYEINQTRVLDDATVLFRLRANDEYVNRLRRLCPMLKIQGGFSYTVHGDSALCRGDAIRVLDSTGGGAACMLGDFEKVAERSDQPSAK